MVQILRADMMLTPEGEVRDAELEIGEDGRITYAGQARRGAAQQQSVVTHDFSGHALLPGLVNGHTHSAMTVQRGISDDEGFMPWLRAVQSLEQGLTREDVAVGLELAMLEMIATGTTTFADMYFWDEDLLQLVKAAGMRVLAAPALTTTGSAMFPSVSPMVGAEVLDETERLAAQFAGDDQIRLAYGPHAPYTCPPELLREIAQRSEETGLPIHIHVSESHAELEYMSEHHGETPAEYLSSIGFMSDRVIAAHCVHLTASEIEMFAELGAAASHNPVSNLKLGCGVAPLPEMLEAGVRLSLGTDSVASNNSLDLFEELKLAAILHRGVRHDAASTRASDVFDIATRRGAEAVGFPETGSLTAGQQADVVALDLTGPHATPLRSLASHLVFSAAGQDVRHVFIGGRHVYAEGEHLTLDAKGILARARETFARLSV